MCMLVGYSYKGDVRSQHKGFMPTCLSRAARSRMLCSVSTAIVLGSSEKRSTRVGPSANTVTYTCDITS